MKQLAGNYKRIVIKIGSSIFYKSDAFDQHRFSDIVLLIASLIKNESKEIIVVSSGAIALGMHALQFNRRPKELSYLQASAAVGQNILMDNYSSHFKKCGITCAQILLTWDDFDSRKRYLNAKNTLLTLLKLSTVPIINENDTVSTDEIKFGDNDTLSARVASMVSADLLIILSDVDGLLDRENNLIPLVDEITPEIKSLACPTNKHTCVGGMVTKIEAAKIAVNSGIPCVIANGKKENIVSLVIKEPEKYGTLFINEKSLTEKKRWIAFATKPKGSIVLDDGAKRAILNKKSLLSVGVISSTGVFVTADIVSLVDKEGFEFARGKTAIGSKELDKIQGRRSDKEVIHCNNIVIL